MTSVGATQLYPDQTVNDPESAMQVNLTAFNIAHDPSGPTGAPYDYFASCKIHRPANDSQMVRVVS